MYSDLRPIQYVVFTLVCPRWMLVLLLSRSSVSDCCGWDCILTEHRLVINEQTTQMRSCSTNLPSSILCNLQTKTYSIRILGSTTAKLSTFTKYGKCGKYSLSFCSRCIINEIWKDLFAGVEKLCFSKTVISRHARSHLSLWWCEVWISSETLQCCLEIVILRHAWANAVVYVLPVNSPQIIAGLLFAVACSTV